MMNRPQNPEEGENPSRTSKLPAGEVVLLVLVGLLAAALFVIYRLSFSMLETNKSFQTLKEENEALRRNISEYLLQVPYPVPPSFLFEEETHLKERPKWEKYRGSLYYFSTSTSTWNDSRYSCIDQGGNLVKIDSREEQMFLELRVRDLMENDGEKFWIGLTDSVEEGKWFWVDGSPLNESLSFWMRWEPDNRKIEDPGGEDCGGMGKKGGADDLICWYDQNCGFYRRSICEKPAEDDA